MAWLIKQGIVPSGHRECACMDWKAVISTQGSIAIGLPFLCYFLVYAHAASPTIKYREYSARTTSLGVLYLAIDQLA